MVSRVAGDKEDTVPKTVFQRLIVVNVVFEGFVVERDAPLLLRQLRTTTNLPSITISDNNLDECTVQDYRSRQIQVLTGSVTRIRGS